MPVDKIFALLNLPACSHSLEPDYVMSKADIYRKFAELAIKDGDGGTVLSEAALTNRADPDLPSWVPGWSEAPTHTNLSQVLIASSEMFFDADGSRHAGRRRPKPRLRIQQNILFVRGAILQSVVAVGMDRSVPGTNANEAPKLTNLLPILSYVKVFLEYGGNYPTGGEKSEVVGILLEADQLKGLRNVTSFWENTHSRDLLFEPALSALSQDHDRIFEAMRRRRLEDQKGYASMCRAVAGRRLALTDEGYVGIVPDTSKEGDKVCILQGFNVPFVLRQVGEQYSLVGDAYLQGIMMVKPLCAMKLWRSRWLRLQSVEYAFL
jgi:hypothetical protein